MGTRRPVVMPAVCISVLGADVGFANEDVASDWLPPVGVELSDKDLAEIRTDMIGHAPVLAASPGMKAATAYHDANGTHADVVFYPCEDTGAAASIQAAGND